MDNVDHFETQPSCSSREPRTRAMSVQSRERSRSRSITLPCGRQQGRRGPRSSMIEPGPSCNRESAQRSLRTPTPDDDEHEQRLRDNLIRNIRRRDRVLDDELEQRPVSRPTHSRYHYSNDELERRSINDYRDSNDELERRSINNYRDRSRSRHNDLTDRELVIRHDSRSSMMTTPNRRQGVSVTRQETDRDKFVEESQKSSHEINQFLEALKCFNKGGDKLNSVNNVIPEFDPMNKNQSITDWLAKVDECAEIYEWSEREIIHYALPKLVGLAKSWYESLSSVKFSWIEWKTKLTASFPCSDNYAELLSEMLALKVKYGEPLERYYYSKLNLLNRCQITGKKAVDCILYGIEDRAIRLGAQAAQFKSSEEVLKYLKAVVVGQIKSTTVSAGRVRNDNDSDCDNQIETLTNELK